jgi:hypothetical protein
MIIKILFPSLLTLGSSAFIYRFTKPDNRIDYTNFTTIQLIKYHTDKFENYLKALMDINENKLNEGLKNRLDIVVDIKSARKELVNTNELIRIYLNDMVANLLKQKYEHTFDYNEIVEHIREFEEVRKIIVSNRNYLNSVFDNYQEIVLRLLSNMIIINKNNGYELLNEDNLKYALDYCRDIIRNEREISDSLVYNAKKVLVNNYTTKDYYYSDFLLEVNKKDNFIDLLEEKPHVKQQDYFDYDFVFLHGLNVILIKLGQFFESLAYSTEKESFQL